MENVHKFPIEEWFLHGEVLIPRFNLRYLFFPVIYLSSVLLGCPEPKCSELEPQAHVHALCGLSTSHTSLHHLGFTLPLPSHEESVVKFTRTAICEETEDVNRKD